MTHTDFSRWRALWNHVGADGDPLAWHRRLIDAYSEKQRHYHTLQHLNECLCEFDAVRGEAINPTHVEMALWFHDAVYDPRSPTNEEDSATLAVSCLQAAQVADESVETIRLLILCTKTHRPDAISDAALLIDIDLAILGQGPQRYWDYEHAIAVEYAWVLPSTYREKRAEILSTFLKRPALYLTEVFRKKYEAPARKNLSAAITRLQVPSP